MVRAVNRRSVTVISLIGYFLIGSIPIMLAPALPFLIRAFDLTLTSAGAVFVARSAGSFLGIMAGGFLSDRLGRKPVIVAGCLLQGILMALVAVSPNWFVITAFFGLIGLATGLINPSINAMIAEVNSRRRAAALNALHGVYSLGAMIGPLVAGLLLASRFGWQAIFFGGSLIWLLYGLSLLFVQLPKTVPANTGTAQPGVKPLTLFLNPLFLLLFAVSFLYNGTATSLVSWINTYLDQTDFPILLGAGMVSIFYLGLAIGRFTCGILSEKIGYARLILICAVGSLIFYPVAIYAAPPLLIALGVLLAGLFFSGLHPTSLAYATRLYPEIGGAVSSLLAIAMTVGAMSVPWLTGFAADLIGFRMSFAISVGLLMVLVGVAVLLIRREKRG